MIDLRSDTQTKPTPEMREAIASAEVGDEQKREDPTVNRLEELAASLLGQEAAVFVPTATMANEIALRTLGEPGDEVVAEENSHILLAELGGPAVHSGLMIRPLRCEAGRFSPAQLRETVRVSDGTHIPPTKIVSVENTHNASGGRVWPLAEIEAVVATARELGLRLHLDGARVMNAAVASGVPSADIGRRFDTVTQDTLELDRIVRVRKLSGTRQIQIVQSRDPEPQRRRTQERRPLRAFAVGQRSHRVVGAGQRVDFFRIKGSLVVSKEAPIVHRDREIVRKKIGRRETEVDDAGDVSVLK